MKDSNQIRVVFRADGNSKTGLGHIFRSLSMIDMLKNDFECVFMINKPDPSLIRLIESYCKFVLLNAATIEEELSVLDEKLLANDIVVTDGYQFDEVYQQFLKAKVRKLVMVDDMADKHYYADLIINHGDASVKDKYRKENYTKVLAGFPYSIIRKEYLRAAQVKKVITKIDTIFICMGGADPFNITIKAITASLQCDFINQIVVVTGSAYSNRDELKKTLNAVTDKKIIHEENIAANRMVELINMSEIAITPASSIAMEICCVKAGLLSGTVIDNQEAILKQLISAGCCLSLGDFNTATERDIADHLMKLNDRHLVTSLVQKQAVAIDGVSGERILNEFKMLVA
nr:UDP-2,4-diacetamido-2,4,6-trideoxy-beta-L-altropyranose hydrolase [Longitalea arenae]